MTSPLSPCCAVSFVSCRANCATPIWSSTGCSISDQLAAALRAAVDPPGLGTRPLIALPVRLPVAAGGRRTVVRCTEPTGPGTSPTGWRSGRVSTSDRTSCPPAARRPGATHRRRWSWRRSAPAQAVASGRSRPHRRPGRRRAAAAGRLSGHGASPAAGRRGRAAGSGVGRGPRRLPLLRVRDRDGGRPRSSWTTPVPRSSRPPAGPTSSCGGCTASRKRRSRGRFRWPGACRDRGRSAAVARGGRRDRPSCAPGRRPPICRRSIPSWPKEVSVPGACTSVGTCSGDAFCLRPLGAVRGGRADQPQHAGRRSDRAGQVELRQGVPVAPAGLRPPGVGRRPEGRVRPAGGRLRHHADPGGARLRDPAQPARAGSVGPADRDRTASWCAARASCSVRWPPRRWGGRCCRRSAPPPSLRWARSPGRHR